MSESLLEVEGLSAFYGRAHILRDVAFTIGNESVAIVGRNGMGKSTIVNVLSGSMKPNLGKYDQQEVSWDEVLKYYQGTELKSHFEKIASGNMRASIKPQLVYLIPNAF